MKSILTLSLIVLPLVSSAQGPSLQNFFTNLLNFTSDRLVPFLFGLAFLFFVINAVRFFIIQGDNEDGRKNAKALALYSISAFVLLVLFWGIVNMLASSIGLQGKAQPCPDYIMKVNPSACP